MCYFEQILEAATVQPLIHKLSKLDDQDTAGEARTEVVSDVLE